jgi:vacuolar-type H+-ATPase subunit I/STV1
MKHYYEYDSQALATMTEAQVQRLIAIELAEHGIVPVEAPEAFSLENAGIRQSTKAYKVGGLILKRREDAETIIQTMDLLEEGCDYSGAGYNYKWLKPLEATVETVFYYSEDEVHNASKQLKEFKARKEEYQKERDAYDSYISDLSKQEATVWSAVREARQEEYKLQQAHELFKNYIDLAEGDIDIATNFFKKAYGSQEDIMHAVLGVDKGSV